MEKLTEEDINMLKYFWQEKGSITRWSSFDIKKKAIKEQFPEVIKAWDDYRASIKIMDAVINNIEFDEE